MKSRVIILTRDLIYHFYVPTIVSQKIRWDIVDKRNSDNSDKVENIIYFEEMWDLFYI